MVLESTSPPGATEKMAAELLAARPDLSLDGADGKGIILLPTALSGCCQAGLWKNW